MPLDLYHGSVNWLNRPVYGAGKLHNDYGQGFYCTRNPDMAREWSVDKDRDGYVNHYQIDTEGMTCLDLSTDQYHMMNWLAILLKNRHFQVMSPLAKEAKNYILREFLPEYKQADIIIGYRADDSYFTFAQDFLNNVISYRQLAEAMHLGKLGIQYMIQSKKAFDQLTFQGAESVPHEIWYPRKELRDRMARKKYFDMNKDTWQRGDIYVLSILEQEMRNDDLRLR